jgi:RNA polymerase sigma-70 factor (ECF subfamily)
MTLCGATAVISPTHSGLGPHAVVRLLPRTATDATLIASLKAREPGSAELLYGRYKRVVEIVILRTVGFDSEVQDLIHEVFTRALERIRSLRESGALKAWITSVAYFTGRAFVRDRRIRRRWLVHFSSDDAPEPAAIVASPEVRRTLAHAYAVLRALPPNESSAFSLRIIEGMARTEIARVAGVSLATANRRMARAERRFWQRARRDPMLSEHVPSGT